MPKVSQHIDGADALSTEELTEPPQRARSDWSPEERRLDALAASLDTDDLNGVRLALELISPDADRDLLRER